MNKLYVFLFCFLLVILSCKEEEGHRPLVSIGKIPDPVTNVQVENLPGAARLTYRLPPNNPDLMYVKAEFETQGIKRNAIATYYNNTLLVEGFGDTRTYELKLYVVNRDEIYSEPVIVNVTPLSPPVMTTFESLTLNEDFGGSRVNFVNETMAELAITVIFKDKDGFWVKDETLYTKQQSASFAVRGFDPVPTIFGVYIEDRWGNVSDTLTSELTPLYEAIIPKPFTKVVLPTDNTTQYNATYSMEKMWDDNISASSIFYTAPNSGVPTWFTFDLGVTAKLSRFLYQQRNSPDAVRWSYGNPRYFEIWGTSNFPQADGSWDGWTKLMDVESVKPSGLPVGQNSDEDIALMMKGEEFNFPLDAPAVRYIRVKVNGTWNNATFIHIAELTFWGEFK